MKSVLALLALSLCAATSSAQNSHKFDPYFADWHNAQARNVDGLSERDIYTRGDPHNSPQPGAVLQFLNSYRYATLAAHASTKARRLEGQQEVLFVDSGRGTATAGGQNVDLHRNIAVLVPANLEFTLQNTGDQPLAMYIINEPTPANFRPNANLLVRDENTIPFTSTDGLWTHMVKTLFTTQDGLGTLQSVLTVTLDPLTIGKPHIVDHEDIEEVWTALDGTSIAFVGNELRKQPPGMSFYHIPDNRTPHTNINQNEDTQVRFLYFARYHPHEPRP